MTDLKSDIAIAIDMGVPDEVLTPVLDAAADHAIHLKVAAAELSTSIGQTERSKSDEYGTPRDLFDEMNLKRSYILDLAASEGNALCPFYFTKEINALEQDWALALGERWGWLNPPYSRGNKPAFTVKAKEEARKGAHIDVLIPADTSEVWFHDIWRDGNVLDTYAVRRGPLKGKVFVFDCIGCRVTMNFLEGRKAFAETSGKDDGKGNTAPKGSVLISFEPPHRSMKPGTSPETGTEPSEGSEPF